MSDNSFNQRGKSSHSRSFGNKNRGFGRDNRQVSNSDFSDGQSRLGNSSHNDRKGFNKGRRFSNSNSSNDRHFKKRSNFRQSDRQRRNDNTANFNTSNEPFLPQEVKADLLDSKIRSKLRGLRPELADKVARHLVMAGQLVDVDPAKALEHANFALKCANRIPDIREAVALCAYHCGDYSQTLRELRAYERLAGKKILPAIEADCLRANGKVQQAIELISSLDMRSLDHTEQVEVVIVSAGIRVELGEGELGLKTIDKALASVQDGPLKYRLLEAKAGVLQQLSRDEQAQEILDSLPVDEEEIEIIDLDELQDQQAESLLSGSEVALCQLYDLALFDLDGVCFRGNKPVENAALGINTARSEGMSIHFVTNNASRTPEQVAEKLRSFDIQADSSEVMTAAMDIAQIMKEDLGSGKVLVVGGQGLKEAILDAGFELVDSYEQEPVAVVQGWDSQIQWSDLSQMAYAIEKGAVFYASNLDSTLPTEHGMALGNGSLVAAVQHATNKKPIAGGKPFPAIFKRSVATAPQAKYPIAIGDRLGTDIAGAKAAGYPSMHVLTGVNDARDVAYASVENRPSYLALDITGLIEKHPYVQRVQDGFQCEDSAVVSVNDQGQVVVDGVVATQDLTFDLNTYRAYVSAVWDAKDNRNLRVDSPRVEVVK